MPEETREQIESLTDGTLAAIPNIMIAIIVFVLFLAIAAGVKTIVRNLNDRAGRESNLGIVLSRLVQWAIILAGLLIAFTIMLPSLAPVDLIELLGISSVAIGFAFRDILQNFAAGILILLTRPFRIGDQIIVNDYEGTVTEIQTRATYIRTYDGRRVVIPNATLFTESVLVNTAFEKRRLEYDTAVNFSNDVDHIRQIIIDAVRNVSDVLHDPSPEVLVLGIEMDRIQIRVRWWIRPPRRSDALDTKDEVIVAMKKAFAANESISELAD